MTLGPDLKADLTGLRSESKPLPMIKILEGVVCHKFLWIEAAMEEVLLDQLENEDQAPNFQADQAVNAQDHEKLVSEICTFRNFSVISILREINFYSVSRS